MKGLGGKSEISFSDCLLAIAGIGMVAEELRCLGASFLFQVLEEGGQLHRIVSGVVHDARTDGICLRLHVARVLQEDRSCAELQSEARSGSYKSAAE